MEALEFIDDDVLLFLVLSLLLLFGFMVWFFIKEYRGLKTEEPKPVEVPVVEPPVLNEPVGIDTQTFNEQDKKEVEEVRELVQHYYPIPQEAAPYPLPVEVEKPVRTIEGPFADRYDLIGFLQTNNIQAAIHLDGVVLQGGFGPPLEYVTRNGIIVRNSGV